MTRAGVTHAESDDWVRVNAKLDESDIGLVRQGMDVRFHVDAYPSESFTGRVSQVRLQGEIVSNVVTYLTVIEVANPDLKLKPGMTAQVTVEVAKRLHVLRLPNLALRVRPTAEQLAALGVAAETTPVASLGPGKGARPATVWRSVGKTFERVAVQVGLTDGSFTEIVGGALKADDRVATVIAAPTTAAVRPTANLLTATGRGGPGAR